MENLTTPLGDNPWQRYFSAATLLFILSFMLLPSAKMVNNVFYTLLALPGLAALLLARFGRVRFTPIFWLWGVLFSWLIYIGTVSGTLQYAKHVLYVLLFLLIVGQFLQPQFFVSRHFCTGLFWCVSAYMGGSSLFYWLAGHYDFGARIVWLPARMDGPIYSSIWLTACFALALPDWIKHTAWKSICFALLSTVFIAAFALQSRSGLVGLLVIFTLFVLHAAMNYPVTRKFLGAISLFIVLLCTWAFFEVPQFTALFTRGDAFRFEIWGALIREWSQCGLITGCGLGHVSTVVLSSGGPIFHPHSIYLALGLYTGLPALVIFVLIMGLTLGLAWRTSNPWGLYLFCALIGLAFDGGLLIGNPDELWLLILLPAALIIHPGLTKAAPNYAT